jgi:ankyrin repeat protein
MAACNVQNFNLAELLLQRGADVNAQSVDGKTALIQTARLGSLDLFRLLLTWGADLSIYDEQAKNALMYACSENRETIVRYLMAQPHTGVNDYKVDTALWYAAAAGHAGVVQLLIEAGALIEYRLDGTIYSTTPLMEACEWGHVDVVELLLHHGADVGNRTGRKALNLARRSGYHDVVASMERWEKRLDALCSFIDDRGPTGDTVPASALPLILQKAGCRPELTHRILRYRIDVLERRHCG